MPQTLNILTSLMCGLTVAGCSSAPQSDAKISPAPASTDAKRSTPVVAERPARMYIWAGFDEKNCHAITPTLAVAQAPTKGTISFKPNQMTKIQHSTSGKCIGQNLPGIGIYYTARKGQIGNDHFSVTATTPSGHKATRAFQVQIVE